ncbi:hypothetical protein K2P56_01060 [Patescibacteria group bacterium]|nr:hypothetical protein [Patescibacteria group bacterium]
MTKEKLLAITFPGKLRDGTPVKVWYINGCLQVDYDGELNGEPVFDLTGTEFPDFISQNKRNQTPRQAFWASVRVINRENIPGTSIGLRGV